MRVSLGEGDCILYLRHQTADVPRITTHLRVWPPLLFFADAFVPVRRGARLATTLDITSSRASIVRDSNDRSRALPQRNARERDRDRTNSLLSWLELSVAQRDKKRAETLGLVGFTRKR